MACPLQRLHRSRGHRLRGAPLGFQLPRDPSRRPSASSVQRFRSTLRRLRVSRANAFPPRFGRRASRLDLPELSPSAHDPRTAGTHPAGSVSPRFRPTCTAASHGVSVFSNSSIRARRTSFDVPLCSRSTVRHRCFVRMGKMDDAVATSTATSARCALRPRISHRVFAHFGNQRSALRASLTFEQHRPPQTERSDDDRLFRGCSRQARRTNVRLLPRALRPAQKDRTVHLGVFTLRQVAQTNHSPPGIRPAVTSFEHPS